MERLQKKGLKESVSLVDSSIRVTTDSKDNTTKDNTITNQESRAPPIDNAPEIKRPKLSQEQLRKIDENRQKALKIRQELDQNNRDATITKPEIIQVPRQDSKSKDSNNNNVNNRQTKELPSIKKSDYIEYDFSTMKDSHGGFMNEENVLNDMADSDALNNWKEKQNQEHIIRELPPPIDISQAPKCIECGSLEVDPTFMNNFQVKVCRKCAKQNPDKYSLLTKTECKEDYLLTEPELKDESLLPRLDKPNPHGYSRMQLFLRFQVEEFAAKKWGSLEGLDKEWEKREEMRIKRKDKKYKDKLKVMRRKTRAEEFSRKIRGSSINDDQHTHDWVDRSTYESEGMKFVTKRCIDCGIESDQLVL